MLIPSIKVVFEGLSREYYARQKALAAAKLDGCIRLAFADFEGVIFFRRGKAVTALEECGMWMALGDEMVPPLENKAVVTEGTMAVYELSAEMIDFFVGRKIVSTVEAELEPLLPPRTLIDNLLRERSTCIFKVRGPSWIGYAFIAFGMFINASYASDRERLNGDAAASAIRRASGKAEAALYFLEGGASWVEAPPSVLVEKPADAAGPAAPVEAAQPPAGEPTAPSAIIVRPESSVMTTAREVELKVATTGDAGVRVKHPSRQSALEALEDRSVAWVDGDTLGALGAKELGTVALVLRDGKSQQVTLVKLDMLPRQGKVVILPRKLRRRLSITPGDLVLLRPGSSVVPTS